MRALIALLLMSSAAFANGCGPHDDVLAALKRVFGETVHVRAMQNNATLLEITVNPATHTWTAIITDAAGTSCAPASGDHFEAVKSGDPA